MTNDLSKTTTNAEVLNHIRNAFVFGFLCVVIAISFGALSIAFAVRGLHP